jgi:hypothetical protein
MGLAIVIGRSHAWFVEKLCHYGERILKIWRNLVWRVCKKIGFMADHFCTLYCPYIYLKRNDVLFMNSLSICLKLINSMIVQFLEMCTGIQIWGKWLKYVGLRFQYWLLFFVTVAIQPKLKMSILMRLITSLKNWTLIWISHQCYLNFWDCWQCYSNDLECHVVAWNIRDSDICIQMGIWWYI